MFRTSLRLALVSPQHLSYRNAYFAPRRQFSSSPATTMAAFFPAEPKGPSVTCAIPGPIAQKATAELDAVFDIAGSINMMCDYEKSIGNYISDLDGNKLLDV